MYVYNVHCKQIIFGASADNGYASFLSSFFIGTDVSSRIRLLKGPPFSFEFKSVLPKFRWTEFNNVFRSDFISAEPLQHHGPRRVPEVEPQTAHESFSGSKTHSSSTPWSAQGNSELYATRAATSDTVTLALGNANLPSRPKKSGVEQYDDPNGVAVSNVLQYVHSRTVSRTSSSSPPQSGHNARPTANDVAAALISSTYERLHVSPKALDFGVVKQMVEEKLGLTFAFWGKDDRDEWFSKSKNIIKMAVVSIRITISWNMLTMLVGRVGGDDRQFTAQKCDLDVAIFRFGAVSISCYAERLGETVANQSRLRCSHPRSV